MKKTMLFLFGIGDTFLSSKSRRCIRRHDEVIAKVDKAIENGKDGYFGVVRFNEPSDTFVDVNPYAIFPSSRIIDVKLCSNDPFDMNNEIKLFDGTNDAEVVLHGNQLDHVIRPEDFDVHIAGIDINGVFIPLIDKMLAGGFDVTVYSDAIKPYNRSTIDAIRNSKVRFRKS